MSESFQLSEKYPNLHRWALGVLARDALDWLESVELAVHGLVPMRPRPDPVTVERAHTALDLIRHAEGWV